MSISPGERVNLSLFPPCLHKQAKVALLEERNVSSFLGSADNMDSLEIVYQNYKLLQSMGLFEGALLDAFIGCRLNNHHVPYDTLLALFELADRDKLRAAGDPLPSAGPFPLYRGVAGIGKVRRIRGWSWTAPFL